MPMTFDISAYLNAELGAHQAAFDSIQVSLQADLANLVEVCARSIEMGGKVMFFGNGGSAADAQHLAAELAVRYLEDRGPIAAVALTTDSSALTAGANDMGFENVFARQIEALGRPGDVAIGLSTSGNSANILQALKMATSKGIVAAGFGGRDGGQMAALADPMLIVPVDDTPRIQEMHILLGHMLCGALELRLGLL
jgi:D-sedoheptulose 7-phosphate isomerase